MDKDICKIFHLHRYFTICTCVGVRVVTLLSCTYYIRNDIFLYLFMRVKLCMYIVIYIYLQSTWGLAGRSMVLYRHLTHSKCTSFCRSILIFTTVFMLTWSKDYTQEIDFITSIWKVLNKSRTQVKWIEMNIQCSHRLRVYLQTIFSMCAEQICIYVYVYGI